MIPAYEIWISVGLNDVGRSKDIVRIFIHVSKQMSTCRDNLIVIEISG